MEISVVNKNINISPGSNRISICSGNKEITLLCSPNVIHQYSNASHVFTHQLSQTDIDNKFISVPDLNSVSNKEKVILFLEGVGIELAYNYDYSIIDDKITWSGYQLEGVLMVNEIIKILY